MKLPDKKINITFISAAVGVTVIGIIHSLWIYLKWIFSPNYSSSAPAEVAFFFVVPYLLVSGLIAVSMVLFKKINAKQEEEGFKAINKYFIIPILIVLAVDVINTVYFFIDYVFDLGTQSIMLPDFYMFIFVPYALICIVLLAVWLIVGNNNIKKAAN